MNHSVIARVVSMILLLTMAMPFGFRLSSKAKEEADFKNISLPFRGKDGDKAYEYLYLAGGYYSVDNGCPAWGTANSRDVRMIGDKMGEAVVQYADGTEQRVPLIFGYTLWFHNNWQEQSAPFRTATGDGTLKQLLQDTLFLKGAFEGKDSCLLRIRLDGGKPVKSVKIEANPEKNGEPVFSAGMLTSGPVKGVKCGGIDVNGDDAFWDTHTLEGAEPLSDRISQNLRELCRALMTYEEDYQAAPAYEFAGDDPESRTVFSGNPFANIATGVVARNVKSILDRVDSDGMLHTSYRGAPSWRYDGFGYWVVNADSYYDAYYSRDGGRALMTLCEYGEEEAADRSARYANGFLQYFPEHNLTIGGLPIPGHYTVVLNKPMYYSTVLVPQAGWGTKYTKNRFGGEYQNLGNQETDGHGLMMMANYSVWKNLGGQADWVQDNLPAIREGAGWILWCLEHPEVSFAKDGLLYAESEAGMMQYTLYCNVPCMLGLYGYAEMAEAAGLTEEAKAWRTAGDGLKAAIEKKFLKTRTGTWASTSFGFYHDPVLTMLADYFGYDVSAYPAEFAEWIKASRRSYEADLKTVSDSAWFGASGIGYNHSMITQNALLTDHMGDASALVENLCRISYAPRLPDPYIVPEGISYEAETGALRRQGDLGNLVQAAEALKVFDLVRGIGAVKEGVLSVLPRLPMGWNVETAGHPVQNSRATADLKAEYPKDGVQHVTLKLKDSGDIETVSFRFGPLPADTKFAAVEANGKDVPCSFSLSGDSAWVYANVPNDGTELRLTLLYASDRASLGTFPVENGETVIPETKKGCGGSFAAVPVILLMAAALALLLVKKMPESARKWVPVLCAVLLCGSFLTACRKPEEPKPVTVTEREPGLVAEAPTWEPEEEEEEKPAEFDSSRYKDLVRGNPDVRIFASSTEGGNSKSALGPASCFDGNPETRWSSEQRDVDGCFLRADFGYPVEVNGVFVDEVKIWGKIADWEAQYWDEQSGEWVSVYEEFSFSDGTYYGFGQSTPKTRSFRLLFHESSSLAISLYEVRIMGEFAAREEGSEPTFPDWGETPASGIPEGLENLARQGTYTASSTENEGTAAELKPSFSFDGKEDTRWSTVFHDLRDSWIAVDFGREVTVSGFSVNEVTNWGHVTSYSAQVLVGDSWKTVHEGEQFPREFDVYIALPAEEKCTGFRLMFHDGETLSETVTISEIGVYGKTN